MISRCECLIEELTKLIEAHPAQVEEIRQQVCGVYMCCMCCTVWACRVLW